MSIVLLFLIALTVAIGDLHTSVAREEGRGEGLVTFAEAYDRITSHGWLTRAEAELLWDEVKDAKGHVLEVGCYQGRSTMLLAQALAGTGRDLLCVDPWADEFSDDLSGEETYKRWCENVHSLPAWLRCEVRVFREGIETWSPRPCGLAFLDGDHTYQGTLDQIEAARKAGARTILIHDVNDTGGGLEVKRAAAGELGAWECRVCSLASWRIKA